MNEITRMSAPITLIFVHDGTVTRQVEEDGEFYDVHTIHQIRTINQSGRSYHLVLRVGNTVFYQDQLASGQEKLVDLTSEEHFDDWEIGVSLDTAN